MLVFESHCVDENFALVMAFGSAMDCKHRLLNGDSNSRALFMVTDERWAPAGIEEMVKKREKNEMIN